MGSLLTFFQDAREEFGRVFPLSNLGAFSPFEFGRVFSLLNLGVFFPFGIQFHGGHALD